ncbi:MAG: adenylate kinase [Pseudomonadota bacterium]
MRIAILGNSGGGKSTLARRLASEQGLPLHEVDRIHWQPGWVLAPEDVYRAAHERMLAQPSWLIDGLGRLDSIPSRIERATMLILIDLPLWQHFCLAAERQTAWALGKLEHKPAGVEQMPSTKALFETIWTLDREWLPVIRAQLDQARTAGKDVRSIHSLEALERFDLGAT